MRVDLTVKSGCVGCPDGVVSNSVATDIAFSDSDGRMAEMTDDRVEGGIEVTIGAAEIGVGLGCGIAAQLDTIAGTCVM